MSRLVSYSVKLSEKWALVEPFFRMYPDALVQVRERCGTAAIDFFGLSVRGLLQALNNEVPTEWRDRFKDSTVRQWCEMLNTLQQGLQDFTKFMEKTQPPQTFEQQRMTMGTLKGNLEEAVLMTLKSCFALHDLESATKLTIYEYMMARKEVFNEATIAFNQYNSLNSGRRK